MQAYMLRASRALMGTKRKPREHAIVNQYYSSQGESG
jgi:hypothetical protein